MQKEINLEKVRRDAERAYLEGGLYDAEAVVFSIRNNVEPAMPEAIVTAALGFSNGISGSKCMVGAVAGGVIVLGYFFGRDFPTTPTDPKSQRTLILANELQEDFKKNHKVLCSHVHEKGLATGSQEHKNQLASFAGEVAQKTAEIIAREYSLAIISSI